MCIRDRYLYNHTFLIKLVGFLSSLCTIVLLLNIIIVKTNGEELPDRTFEEAARLAAHYSQNKKADKVEIDYVEKKHVKKVAGAKPGFVIYHTNYSMVIDTDISGIQQLS